MNKTEQPLALRLADLIDYNTNYDLELTGTGIDEQAATELRRLHAENEAAHRVGILQEKELMRLEAENEALREALEETLLFCETFSNRWDGQTGAHPFEMVSRARAALARAGEVK
jgi:hypothetical protein